MFAAADQPIHTTHEEEESLSGRFVALAGATVAGVDAARRWFEPALEEPGDAVVLVAGVALTVITAWWLANVVTWIVVLRRGRTLRRFTLPGTKRLAQLLLVVSLSSACVADGDDAPAMVLVETLDDSATTPTTTVPTTATPSTTVPTTAMPSTTMPSTTAAPTTAAAPTTTAAPTASALPSAPDLSSQIDNGADRVLVGAEPGSTDTVNDETTPSISVAAHQVVVNDGDNLWLLASEALRAHGLDDPSCAAVAQYWRHVVAANRVRSGNVDLIVPGEQIEMPAHELAV